MIELERLIASALGELAGDADAEVEEHVLSCGRCAALYASFLRLGSAVADLVRSGAVVMPLTQALAERLEAEGLVSGHYTLEPGSVVACTVGAHDVYSLTTLVVDLTGIRRVDLIRGTHRFVDVPFDARAGRVRMATRCDFLRTLPSMKLPLRLIAVDAEGDHTLAEYTLDHTGFQASS